MYSERERGGGVRARRGKGSASTCVLRLAMYTVPNLLGGTKVRVVTDRNGGRTRTEEAGGNMHVVLFDIRTDYLRQGM